MLPYPVILTITIVGIVVATFLVYFATGSFFSILLLLAIAGLLFYLLNLFGVLSFKTSNGNIEIDFHENAPTGATTKLPSLPMEIKEVFYVGGNEYTYNDAAAVCAAYGAELASYDQINEAFMKGAEWCGYGWSAGGMALFPTQESTWESLQKESDETKRTACGRPGVNGGYFDPRMKFGVNCYGKKVNNTKFKGPLPLPTTDPSAFNDLVNKFKKMVSAANISPFNRDVWSQSGELKYEAKEAVKKTDSYLHSFESDVQKGVKDIKAMF